MVPIAQTELPGAIRGRLVRPTWVEIDLDAIEHNVTTLKRRLGGVRLIGVLKGDACGFGTAECGLAMQRAGVDMLAVGNAFQVPLLRARGVQCPILLFASFAPESAADIASLGVIATIVDSASLDALSQAARSFAKPLEVFVKIDTGLGRLGVPYADAAALIGAVANTPRLRIVGLYSHCGGVDAARAAEQLTRMTAVLARADELGIEAPFKVLASTPHLLAFPQMWLTAVDPGRLLFGIRQPAAETGPDVDLRPALRALRTRIIQIKPVSAGDPPEYGFGRGGGVECYGVLPFGWTDVFLADAYERSGALVRGRRVRFLARLSAEHSVIDLTNVPGARVGDTVTVLGRDGDACIDVERVAAAADVQVSDITRRFHRHLPFVYFRRGAPVRLKTLAGEVDFD